MFIWLGSLATSLLQSATSHIVATILGVIFTGGVTVAVVSTSTYTYKVTNIAQLQTAQIEVYYDDVTVRINTGGRNLCGLRGTYRVGIELTATIDLNKVIANRRFLYEWHELPEPNITIAYVKSVKPLNETTNFGCNVSFTDTRELARLVSLVNISKSLKYLDLLDETRVASELAYNKFKETDDISFYDDDNGRTFAVEIKNPPCWGLNDAGEFVKTC